MFKYVFVNLAIVFIVQCLLRKHLSQFERLTRFLFKNTSVVFLLKTVPFLCILNQELKSYLHKEIIRFYKMQMFLQTSCASAINTKSVKKGHGNKQRY